jgi:fluoride exporter
MKRLLLVVLGSGIGGGGRYLFSTVAHKALGSAFPYGTLGVNVIGSFLITAVMYLGLEKGILSVDTRIFLTTGVLGGFTTYSAFNYETMQLFERRAFGLGLLNMGVTLVSCLLAAALAGALVKWLT